MYIIETLKHIYIFEFKLKKSSRKALLPYYASRLRHSSLKFAYLCQDGYDGRGKLRLSGLGYNGQEATKGPGQIEEREYYQMYEKLGKQITLVGISFDIEKKNIETDWTIKKL